VVITYPDGEKLTAIFHAVSDGVTLRSRLKYIRSSRGYGLQYSYASDTSGPLAYAVRKITFVNESEAYCSWSAPSDCPALAGVQPVATFTSDNAILDSGGRRIDQQFGGSYGMTHLSGTSVPGVPALTQQITYIYNVHQDWGELAYVEHVTRAGRTWNYNYQPPLSWFGGHGETASMTITDPNNKSRSYESEADIPRVTRITDEINRTTLFEYDSDYRHIATVFPEGNRVQLVRDSRGNVEQVTRTPKTGSTLAPLVMKAEYPDACSNRKTCNKPEYIIDERNNRTDFTYDPVHGGVLTETGPAVNGVRPQTRYKYELKYAYVRDANNALVAEPTGVWLLTGKATCKTQASCAGTADEVRVAYEYGNPGTGSTLLPRGMVEDAGGQALRTCYSYDYYGNRISETKPRAGLASCQ
jgi:hypothetical protein